MEHHDTHEPYYQLQDEVVKELPLELEEDAHLC
ncbi:hypothetical protein EDC28_10470 [Gallaecimonas pentaromativorans]|uniref:Uncharacterized protein n=1 Tax=Gallaecimonas pentaromativorans TaxID=584787 RepID=A0A3N1P7U4_9GAMM|nr:hypothetical protein EDC28_10470 [Gallaecimonas pentaromativorans]